MTAGSSTGWRRTSSPTKVIRTGFGSRATSSRTRRTRSSDSEPMRPARTVRPTASSPAASVRFTFSCPVRWGDMDAFGHVNNVTFFDYMQEARTGMLFAGEAAAHIPDLIKGVVVARHEIDYRRPLEWRPDPVEVDG